MSPRDRFDDQNDPDNTCNSHIKSYLAISPAFGDLKSLWAYKQRQLLTNTDVSFGRAHALSVELLIVSHSCSVSILLSVKSYLTLLPYVTERQVLIPGIEPDSQHANSGQRFTSHSLSAKQHFKYVFFIYTYLSVHPHAYIFLICCITDKNIKTYFKMKRPTHATNNIYIYTHI